MNGINISHRAVETPGSNGKFNSRCLLHNSLTLQLPPRCFPPRFPGLHTSPGHDRYRYDFSHFFSAMNGVPQDAQLLSQVRQECCRKLSCSFIHSLYVQLRTKVWGQLHQMFLNSYA